MKKHITSTAIPTHALKAEALASMSVSLAAPAVVCLSSSAVARSAWWALLRFCRIGPAGLSLR
jgi:hypothetical protein